MHNSVFGLGSLVGIDNHGRMAFNGTSYFESLSAKKVLKIGLADTIPSVMYIQLRP